MRINNIDATIEKSPLSEHWRECKSAFFQENYFCNVFF